MKPIDEKKETVTFTEVSRDEEGKKRVEKTRVSTHNINTFKYIEKKLTDKGVQRIERHPVNEVGIRQPPRKSDHGGKYTWEGPDHLVENELDEVPPAIDEKDPNYVYEEEEKILMGVKMTMELPSSQIHSADLQHSSDRTEDSQGLKLIEIEEDEWLKRQERKGRFLNWGDSIEILLNGVIE